MLQKKALYRRKDFVEEGKVVIVNFGLSDDTVAEKAVVEMEREGVGDDSEFVVRFNQ